MTKKTTYPFLADTRLAAILSRDAARLDPFNDSTAKITTALRQLNSPITPLQKAISQVEKSDKLFDANSDLKKLIAASTNPLQGFIEQSGALQRSATIPKVKANERINISTPNDLGTLIKASRVAKKLTQQQLADLAGVGRRFLIECEAGKPRLEFAKVLQVAATVGIDIFAIKR